MSTQEPLGQSQHGAVEDLFGRQVKSLRLSITQRCDLACAHCHREGQAPSADEMTPDEILKLVEIGSSLGIRKVKITGGEPLMRPDVTSIVAGISPLLKEVSLTTNGLRLSDLAGPLKSAGLSRVNVSLHSLVPERYASFCGVDATGSVVRGIEAAISSDLNPVKVNMVVFKGENEDEIHPMMEFCARVGATLQLIEYEADRERSNGCAFSRRYYPLRDLEDSLAKDALSVSVNELHRRRRYDVRADGGIVTVEVVRPMHNTEFCSNCTRIRMSSNGLLKPCLLDSSGAVDVLKPLRSGASDDEIKALFVKAIGNRRPYWR